MFTGPSSLQSICIRASVEVLDESYLRDYPKLLTVTFEVASRLRRIEARAFVHCPLLKSISLPASVSAIDGSAFERSPIEKIVVDAANRNYFVSGPFLIGFDGMKLIRYFGSSGNVIVDPNSESPTEPTVAPKDGSRLLQIGSYAFSANSTVTSICITDSIEAIGDECFRGCSSLLQLTFEPGSRLTRIGNSAFRECSSLKSNCVPAEVEAILSGCFSGCRSLVELLFEPGSKLARIDSVALENCNSLRRLVIPAKLEIMEFGVLLHCTSLHDFIFETPSSLKQLDLPGSGFDTLYIPDNVEVVRGNIGSLSGQSRVLQFGPESHLISIDLKKYDRSSPVSKTRGPGNQVFVRHSEQILRTFRCKFEWF
jgi:hypothetical protein